MTAATTPGVWVVEPIVGRFNVYTDDARCICIARDCSAEDARLIAAAPRLRDALLRLGHAMAAFDVDMTELLGGEGTELIEAAVEGRKALELAGAAP